MTPETKKALIRSGAFLAFLVVLVWLMRALESVTTVLLVSLFLAYLLNPFVQWLEKRRIPRTLAALGLLALFTAVLTAFVAFVIPLVVGELTAFLKAMPAYLGFAKGGVVRLLEQFNISFPSTWDEFLGLVAERARAVFPGLGKLVDPLAEMFGKIFKSVSDLISALVYLALVPVLVYYLLVSFEDIKHAIEDLIPPYARDRVLEKLREIDRAISGFVRGQLTVCALLAVLYSIGFVIIGIDLAVFLGVLSGFLFVIPYVGTLIALIFAPIMAFVKFGDILHPAYVIGWIVAVQLVEAYFLTPRIVGKAIGLHPVIYILSIIIGAKLLGIVGALIAIPTAAVMKVLLVTAVDAYRKSSLYQDPTN